MIAKKNISVESIKDAANQFILDSRDDQKQSRIDIGNMLEAILMTSGNYKGFRYLSWRDMKASNNGSTVGINTDEDDKNYSGYELLYKDTDYTRVRFY